MAQPSDLEARVGRLELRLEEADAAAAARHLAAARDRDLAGLGVKVDANRLWSTPWASRPGPVSTR